MLLLNQNSLICSISVIVSPNDQMIKLTVNVIRNINIRFAPGGYSSIQNHKVAVRTHATLMLKQTSNDTVHHRQSCKQTGPQNSSVVRIEPPPITNDAYHVYAYDERKSNLLQRTGDEPTNFKNRGNRMYNRMHKHYVHIKH
ncbi:hypothetical protein WN51_13759 [Melipona quadrifasciata]|uniref:Uncharacterized protein n=1 Tax=Melipona quadrifasciata TaxID=166423 RepID=A0A0N0BFQ8_9HYME|nr:hypothetical protein WN51_13759 [Melipona quadrifasciata]